MGLHKQIAGVGQAVVVLFARQVLFVWFVRSRGHDCPCSSAISTCLPMCEFSFEINESKREAHANLRPCLLMGVLQTLKNNSVLKMAAAQQPEVPTRLYKPLPRYSLLWMKRRLAEVGVTLNAFYSQLKAVCCRCWDTILKRHCNSLVRNKCLTPRAIRRSSYSQFRQVFQT